MNLRKYEYAIKLQERLSMYVIREDVIRDEEIRYIAGVDVSYKRKQAYPCMVIIDRSNLEMVYHKCMEVNINTPYIPSLLFLREGNIMLNVLRDEKDRYDLIMVDGNGILHPRRFGLASYIGFMLDKPTIGVAKKLLCGKIIDDKIIDDNEVIGKVYNNLYISIGHKISLDTAVKIVKETSKYKLPEPIRLADKISRKYIS
ncbi:MAG: endonuclease V [Candidatus Nitrosocaldaceae archaeon]|nr:MAG: endonuclease V [Candidatus Nitrosocaldaceae archaeon]